MTHVSFRTRIQSRIGVADKGTAVTLLSIAFGLLVVTLLHYSAAPGLRELHTVYRYFYFLPIVYAALRFGFWGGVVASLAASLAFAPHIFFKWGHFPEDSLNDLLVVVVFYGVAIITGITVDRLRRSQRQQAQTAQQLAASLHQLKVQGEELRRAEHLSALGTLAGGLAHEIRNPVGIIRATAQLIEMECGEAAAETVAIIQQETDRIECFIQDLLTYAGEGQLQREETDIRVLLQRIAGRLRPLLDTYGIKHQIQVAGDLPPAFVDADQLEQALMNLCMNAIQALDGPGQICLSAAQTDGQPLAIMVADTGPGIAPADRVRIFDPFYTTKDSGTGMGLSVVQRIVEHHGGWVEVESEPGQGATFTIHLPLEEKLMG